ncbi:uncharacterized protein B0I36DRAFT_366885 [Microdochium trichocladiopsis]|uniref:Serine protease n=1 Tax=Microdochium trichocladiopsis TaxID=1682393 RepID=A0A9P9BLJ9_9PEZI|nr:uncharacterized protein B0I36DRAFT_366885 [Microdochium trichocladiopsis]KAH7024987.1 hypothetical protein B0I36DRAFT_366885 [Microdochium trichocladiopsis]
MVATAILNGLVAALAMGSTVAAAPSKPSSSRRDEAAPGTTTITWNGNDYEVGYDPERAAAIFADAAFPAGAIPRLTEADLAAIASVTGLNATAAADFFVGTEPQSDDAAAADKRDWSESWHQTNSDFPYRALGRITWQNGAVCSGTLVGSRLVLTASHCIPPDNSAVSFSPWYNYGNDATFGTYWATHYLSYGGGDGSFCQIKNDWALIVISERVGQLLGYLGARNVGDDMLNWPYVHSCGYPGAKGSGRDMYCHNNIRVDSYGGCGADGPVLSNALVYGGQSGSGTWTPFGGSPYSVFGVVSASIGAPYDQTGHASGQSIPEAVLYMRSEFP